jgi:hypothetical protein
VEAGPGIKGVERNPGKRTDLTSSSENARLKGLLKTIGLFFPINQAKVRARWKLGQALKLVKRTPGDRTSSSALTRLLSDLGLTRQRHSGISYSISPADRARRHRPSGSECEHSSRRTDTA